MYKTYRYRLHPNSKQLELIQKNLTVLKLFIIII